MSMMARLKEPLPKGENEFIYRIMLHETSGGTHLLQYTHPYAEKASYDEWYNDKALAMDVYADAIDEDGWVSSVLIVVAYNFENGLNVCQDFSKADHFYIAQFENRICRASGIGSRCGLNGDELALMLAKENVDVVICGNIDEKNKAALEKMKIVVEGGIEGRQSDVAEEYILRHCGPI